MYCIYFYLLQKHLFERILIIACDGRMQKNKKGCAYESRATQNLKTTRGSVPLWWKPFPAAVP